MLLKYFSTLRTMKMMPDLSMYHRKMYDFVSFPLLAFTLLQKLRNFDFESYSDTLIFFDKTKWCQIWINPIKQCLIWFNLRCFSSILVISSEIQSVIEIVQCFPIKESVVKSKFVPIFLSYFYFIWNYCKNSFELKKFLMILKYIQILLWNFCI